jgi:hypothetical protein
MAESNKAPDTDARNKANAPSPASIFSAASSCSAGITCEYVPLHPSCNPCARDSGRHFLTRYTCPPRGPLAQLESAAG